MNNLLIVDDEPIIVDGLLQLFSETDFDLELYSAYSAKEALDLAIQIKVDIIITDMRMPKKSGLKLIDELLLIWPKCRIIFLSGYDQFDYVYDAIKRNVDSYVLKTEDDEVLINAVSKSIELIKQEEALEANLKVSSKKLEQAEPLLKRELLKSLLNGDNIDEHLLSYGLDHHALKISIDEKWLMVAGQIEYNQNLTFQSPLILAELIKQSLHPKLTVESYMYNQRLSIWLIQPLDTNSIFIENKIIKSQVIKNYIKRFLKDIQEKYMDKMNLKVSFVINKDLIQTNQANESLHQMLQMSAFISSFSQEMIVIDLSKETSFYPTESGSITTRPWKKQIDLLEEFISDGKKQKAIDVIESLYSQIINNNYTHLDITEIIYSISQLIIDYLRNKTLYNEVLKNQDQNFESIFKQIPILFDSKEKVISTISAICDYKEEWKIDGNRKIILIVDKYIRENITEDLSLTTIADLVHFNPSYLSRFYKEHTGTNLSDAINEIRLRKAKDFLTQTEKPIHQIADELGFNSPSYFTLYFKKHTNHSPQKYREYKRM